MKRLIVNCLAVVFTLGVWAQGQGQGQQRFSPEKFQADMEQYIAKEAGLTPREAAAFFPMFREMQQKQRALFKQHRQYSRTNPQNDQEATQLIKNIDNVEMQMKKIEMQYHDKFLKVLSPIKVYKVHLAVNKFKHITMERVAKRKN